MKTVTRADLAIAASDAGSSFLPLSGAKELVDQVLDTIAAELIAGSGQVKIPRFGSFVVVRAPARVGRNPKRPDEAHAIPAQSRVGFRAAAELKQHIDRG